MEDEVRAMLLRQLAAASVSQLVLRRRVPDNGAATMRQSRDEQPGCNSCVRRGGR